MDATAAPEESTPELTASDPEMRQILGLFDVPAFARRGQDLEHALQVLHSRLRRERDTMLEMVRLRIRQWASVATSPEDGRDVLSGPIGRLIEMLATEPVRWAPSAATPPKRRPGAPDLAAG